MLRLGFRRFTVAVLLLAIALPWLISSAARYWLVDRLEQLGAERVEMAGFWLNPYSAIIELDNIELHGNARSYRLSSIKLELLWRDLWKKKIHITKLNVTDVDVVIDQSGGDFLINGLHLASETAALPDDHAVQPSPAVQETSYFHDWNVAVDQLQVEGINITWSNDSASLLARLNTFSMTSLDTETDTETELDLNLQLSQLRLDDQQIEASSHINYTALIELQRQAGRGWEFKWLGNLVISDTQASVPEFFLDMPRVEVGITSEFNVDQNLLVRSDLEVQISDVSLQDRTTQEPLIDFQSLSFNTRYQSDTIDVDNLVLSSFNVLPSQKSLAKSSALLEDVYLNLDSATIEFPSDKDATQIVVDQVTLAAANIHVQRNADGSIVQQLRLQKLQDKVKRALAAMSRSEAQSVQSSQTFAAESLTATDTSSQSSEKALVSNEIASSSKNTVDDVIEHETEPKSVVDFLVRRLSMKSEVDVLFADYSLSPVFKETLSLNHLELENIALDKTIVIDFDADLSYGANIKAIAQVIPQKQAIDGELNLNNYELIAVSGYSELATGYELEAGRFSLTSQFSIDGAQLNSEQNILIDQLSLRVASPDSANSFSQKTAIPMEQALDLLRDSKNKITLNVPVQGDLNNPDIRLQQVINTALKGAMRKASLTVLSTLIQPYGAMISIAKFAGEQVTKVRFEAVPFAAGQFLATREALAYADKVGAVVRERRSLKLKLCGVTNEEDSQHLQRQQVSESSIPLQAKEQIPQSEPHRQALRQLAEARALALRDHLLNDIGVSEEQLLMCLPKHLSSAVAGVELSI